MVARNVKYAPGLALMLACITPPHAAAQLPEPGHASAARVLAVAARTPSPAFDDPQEAIRQASERGRAALVQLMTRKPDGVRRAIESAKGRGWRATTEVFHAKHGVRRRRVGQEAVNVPLSLPAIRPASFVLSPETQEHAYGNYGEILIWEWEDGDPNTFEGTVEIWSYDTGESQLFNVQMAVPDDYTANPMWHDLIHNDSGPEFQARLRLGDSQRLIPAQYLGRCGDPGQMWRVPVQQTSCYSGYVGSLFSRAWQMSWIGGTAAMGEACRSERSLGRAAGCAVRVMGAAFATALTYEFYYGQGPNCNLNTIVRQVCGG